MLRYASCMVRLYLFWPKPLRCCASVGSFRSMPVFPVCLCSSTVLSVVWQGCPTFICCVAVHALKTTVSVFRLVGMVDVSTVLFSLLTLLCVRFLHLLHCLHSQLLDGCPVYGCHLPAGVQRSMRLFVCQVLLWLYSLFAFYRPSAALEIHSIMPPVVL
jgi:hypothetical protein